MSDATHVYCEACQKIQPMDQRPLDMIDVSGKLIGGDLLCGVCSNVITAVYCEMSEAERWPRELKPLRAPSLPVHGQEGAHEDYCRAEAADPAPVTCAARARYLVAGVEQHESAQKNVPGSRLSF